MSYPKNIVQFRPRRGINVDLPPSEVSPEEYTNGRNVHFRDGYAERTQGEAQVYTGLQSNLRNIINIQSTAGGNYWVYTGEDSIHAVEGSIHSDITPAVGLTPRDDPNTFTTSSLNQLLVWNNGDDAPQWWDSNPANPMTELPGWITGDRCEALRPFKYHLFALDMTESVGGRLPQKIKWSSAAEPGAIPQSWTPQPDNDAGDTQLSDTPGPVIDALSLRGSFVLYKQNSTYLCDYIGGQFVMSFRKLFLTSGVLSRNCVTEYNGHHYLVTSDDIIVHDGNTIRSLLDKRARRAVFAGLDQDNFQSSFVANYEKRKEIWFCLPSAGNFFADTAIIYNLEEDAWSQRDLVEVAHAATGFVTDTTIDASWDADSEAWDNDVTNWDVQEGNISSRSLVLASTDETTPTDSRLLEVDIGSDFDGTPISGNLQKLYMDLGEPTRVKIVKRLLPKVVANDGVEIQFRMGGSGTPDGAINWSQPVTYIHGDQAKIDVFAQGRYLSFDAQSTGGPPWTLTGFDLEVSERGYF